MIPVLVAIVQKANIASRTESFGAIRVNQNSLHLRIIVPILQLLGNAMNHRQGQGI